MSQCLMWPTLVRRDRVELVVVETVEQPAGHPDVPARRRAARRRPKAKALAVPSSSDAEAGQRHAGIAGSAPRTAARRTSPWVGGSHRRPERPRAPGSAPG